MSDASAALLAIAALLLLAVIGAASSPRHKGGQRRVRNAPTIPVQSRVPPPPPRGGAINGPLLGAVIGSLLDTYKPEGVGIYLNSPNRNFNGRTPLDLIAAGEGQRVLDEADRLAGGPVS